MYFFTAVSRISENYYFHLYQLWPLLFMNAQKLLVRFSNNIQKSSWDLAENSHSIWPAAIILEGCMHVVSPMNITTDLEGMLAGQ